LREHRISLPNVSRQPEYLTDLGREGVAKTLWRATHPDMPLARGGKSAPAWISLGVAGRP